MRNHAHSKVQWTPKYMCGENVTKTPDVLSVDVDQGTDYRDLSTITNSYYYYSGIRRGPVMCPRIHPRLGVIKTNESVSLDSIENIYAKIEPGGIYSPLECTARQTVAVVVPFREQKTDLLTFLFYIHPILMKQQLEYQIFVIKQYNETKPFNLGFLCNVGFTEAQRQKVNGGWRCVVFHEPHLLPLDSRNLYRCSQKPSQLIATVDKIPYRDFGGVIAIKPKQFLEVNGFSNLYLGNEAVYDDIYKRLVIANSTIQNASSYASYMNLRKEVQHDMIQSKIAPTSAPLYLIDGLSTLSYTLKRNELKRMYTLLEVETSTSDLPRKGNNLDILLL